VGRGRRSPPLRPPPELTIEDQPAPGPLGRAFWTLVGSTGLSNLADGIFKIALPLVAVTYTRSPALVAGLELVRTLPWLLLSLQVGALVDRIDRRHAMVAANVVRAACVAVPAAAIAADAGALWVLYLAALSTGVAEVFYDTSSQSILPSVVDRSQLDRANGRLYAVETGMQQFAGPPLAGLLVAAGVVVAFAAPAGLWLLAVALLLAVRGRFRPTRTGPRTTIRHDVGEGLSFLLGRPVLRTMAVMVGVGNLASSACGAVLVLYAVGDESILGLSEPAFGLLTATTAAGALVGGLVAERIQAALGRGRTLTITTVAMVVWIAVPAVSTQVGVIAAGYLVGGVAIMVWNVTTVSFRQRVTPDAMLGRVNSAYRLLAWGTMPLGAALGGLLGEWWGVRAVFGVMGVVSASIIPAAMRLTDDVLAAAEADAGAA
jgi:MFS family permease